MAAPASGRGARPVRLVKSAARAPIRLAVRGFSAQGAVSAEEIARAIDWLPGFHLQGLREIVYSAGEPLHYPSLGPAPATQGCAEYVQAERTIFVYTTEDPALFWHVLYHEIGHHVYFAVMGSTLKKRWATQIFPGSRCATSYGYSSAAEDFAECYALYAQHTRSLEVLPVKLAFMRDEIFSGARETPKERR